MDFAIAPPNRPRWRCHQAALAIVLLLALPSIARAGLRPQYGGELVVEGPESPVAPEPWRAWNPLELVLADATSLSLADLGWTPGSSAVEIPADATWPDGTPLTAQDLTQALDQAARNAVVSLPDLSFRADGRTLLIDGASRLTKLPLFSLPWLGVSRGGPFAPSTLAAQPGSPARRPYLDQLRVEVRSGRRLDPPADGVLLTQSGSGGRYVFALVHQGSDAAASVESALARLNRESLARLFLRGFGRLPSGWPLPKLERVRPARQTLVIATDDSERDLRTVAERLQVLLRDRGMSARIVAEPRDAYFSRLSHGDYDLALVALPTAPPWVEAATLARLAAGAPAAARVWAEAMAANGATPARADAPLREVARQVGAVLLYREGGAVSVGSRVMMPAPAVPWRVDLARAWLKPPEAPP